MARVFETDVADDDSTVFKIYFGFNKKTLTQLIKELENIKNGKSDDDYIILESKEEIDMDKRIEVIMKFERD